MKEAIYAASLDPITYGHVNIVERALNVFDHILVAIGVNETKESLFSLEEREILAKKELARFGNRVRVKSFKGMLSDFAYGNDIKTVIRGARSTPDFDYEKLLSDINRYSGVDTIIYTTIPRLAHVSSSAAKAITLNAGKNILDYVSMTVKHRLEEKLLYQYRIGVTGVIGSGKSYITELFRNYVINKRPLWCQPHVIDMDKIGHYILKTSAEPIHKKVRKEVCKLLKIKESNKGVDLGELRKKIFDDSYSPNRDSFNNLMREPMMYELRKFLLENKGNIGWNSVVLIVGALLVEMKGLSEFNNNLLMVDCPKDLIVSRLKKSRGYSDKDIEIRLAAQNSLSIKGKRLDEKMHDDGYGHGWLVENDKTLMQDELLSTFDKILKEMGIWNG
jgi:pantetheine-phosphate adenylyltransferase